MSSSISSSDGAAPDGAADAAAWALWLAVFVTWLLGGLAVLYGFIVFTDPYDTGRFGVFGLRGIVDESPRTAVASRGRDPQFDAAIVGNSTGQLLAPARLDALTGLTFVQLTVPGTGPREQFAIIDWFVRHHARIGALIVVTDEAWCTQDPAMPVLNPFPFWLYADNTLDYLGGIFQRQALDRAWRRVRLAFGYRKPSDPAGYADYESGRAWNFRPSPPPPDAPADAIPLQFPAIDRLRVVIRILPGMPVLLVMPPIHAGYLPTPGSAASHRLAQCKAALAASVANRSQSAFLDFLADDPTTRDPQNFMDQKHYRSGIAREMEAQIAAHLRTLRVAPGAGRS